MKYLNNFGTSWGLIPDGDSVSFIDNHGEHKILLYLNYFYK